MGVLPTMISLESIPYLPLVGVNRANACVVFGIIKLDLWSGSMLIC